eukprot:TRINITY_DN4482_c0_g1_i1.p4 TRINITY_DN4482_c0_g1~~TRINITY_DN4482_c0_g1_i1.p4  ORF type:complete len:136 (-),score=37.83 TRINITY_DN4482_c0_g1_i1:452-859(-)
MAQQLLAAGCSLSGTKPEVLNEALLGASIRGDPVPLQELLRAGADLECVHQTCGSTPLVLAARHGHQQLVEEMVAAGADLDAEDKWGQTALGLAATSELHHRAVGKRKSNSETPSPAVLEWTAVAELLRSSIAAR